MIYPQALQTLVNALSALPSVGPKSAMRMALYLTQKNIPAAQFLAVALENAVKQLRYCIICRALSDHEHCEICRDKRRDSTQWCVVENITDVYALEETQVFKGRYFVLRGALSPLDDIGPAELGLDSLLMLVTQAQVNELILATNPTVEGNATAFYIQEMLQHLPIKMTRIAHGVPLGSSINHLDQGTLFHAFSTRQQF